MKAKYRPFETIEDFLKTIGDIGENSKFDSTIFH